MVVILLGPVLVGDPAREQLADHLRDAWGEEEFTGASKKTVFLFGFFYFALRRSETHPDSTRRSLQQRDHKGREVTGRRF